MDWLDRGGGQAGRHARNLYVGVLQEQRLLLLHMAANASCHCTFTQLSAARAELH
jgi:hypothetical protein